MVKKSPCPPSGYFGYEYELTIQFNTVYNSFCACLRLANRRILCFIKIFLENSPLCVGSFENAVLRVTKGEIKQSPAFAVAKGGEHLERHSFELRVTLPPVPNPYKKSRTALSKMQSDFFILSEVSYCQRHLIPYSG